MKLFCIHRWSVWSDVYPSEGAWFQARYCLKCRKAERKEIKLI